MDIDYSINKKDPRTLKFCGSRPSFTVYSTGRELSLKTKELLYPTTGQGFTANYTTVPAGELT